MEYPLFFTSPLQRLAGNFILRMLACFQQSDVHNALLEARILFEKWQTASGTLSALKPSRAPVEAVTTSQALEIQPVASCSAVVQEEPGGSILVLLVSDLW